ncbi:MAG: hypothetical protein DDT32_00745 [Syntrophomonadaceae bacterium]|nr:hypothetical protein [Bacillota bacterium]MBT9146994.1 hypothetical protein [Bacillota bacterium]
MMNNSTQERSRVRKINKVVLSIPNLRWHKTDFTVWTLHPYNLCLLSAMIQEEYDVAIVDANIDNLSRNEFVIAIQREKPDVVGISILTNEYGEAGHIAVKLVKDVNSNIVTVMGGAMPQCLIRRLSKIRMLTML